MEKSLEALPTLSKEALAALKAQGIDPPRLTNWLCPRCETRLREFRRYVQCPKCHFGIPLDELTVTGTRVRKYTAQEETEEIIFG